MKDSQALAQLRMPRGQYESLRAFAAANGMTFSHLVRKAIARFLESELARGLPQ
jgi:predicted DNA-binding protein